MIEAAMIWNEPNNKSHWDPEIDPEWGRFAEMAIAAGKAIGGAAPGLPRVLGGISPIDPRFHSSDGCAWRALANGRRRCSWFPARLESVADR